MKLTNKFNGNLTNRTSFGDPSLVGIGSATLTMPEEGKDFQFMFQNKVQSIVNPLYFLLKEQPKIES